MPVTQGQGPRILGLFFVVNPVTTYHVGDLKIECRHLNSLRTALLLSASPTRFLSTVVFQRVRTNHPASVHLISHEHQSEETHGFRATSVTTDSTDSYCNTKICLLRNQKLYAIDSAIDGWMVFCGFGLILSKGVLKTLRDALVFGWGEGVAQVSACEDCSKSSLKKTWRTPTRQQKGRKPPRPTMGLE